ncbi:MAG TPA: bifunctional molybdenum cofactor biosynthesis protein MoaC/MoaB [Pseudobdellovibrionaceae bacterium]|jgi:molybdenum cofactor biosynthesis protein MoaC
MTFNSEFKMANVAEKISTSRRAIARGYIKMSPATAKIVAEKKLPKGDALMMAEVAGILGVKKTIEILPLCHPLPIESVRVKCEPRGDGVVVSCEVITTYKTGVEMEALMGVNAALLCIYDLTKPIDPVLSIHDIHLVMKEGGKSGLWQNPEFPQDPQIPLSSNKSCALRKSLKGLKTAVLTISDRCSRKQAEDGSGPVLKQMLKEREAEILWSDLVPDEISEIQKAITRFKESGADLIVSTGGTGFSPRDVTPEAVEPMLTRRVEGFGELFRAEGAKRTPMSYLSRSVSGFIGETLIITLPGSPRACREGIDILAYLIPHAIHIAKGGPHGGGHEISK